MILGAVELAQVRQEHQIMYDHVLTLREENADLQTDYREEVDTAYVEKMALSMGMITREKAQYITVQLPQQLQQSEPGFWQSIAQFLAGLFA